MRPVSGHPPFATGHRRPCSDRRRCGVAKAGRSTSRHTRFDGAAHSARHRQMPLRTEPLDRPALSSSSRDFQFLVRDARPSGTLLPDAWHAIAIVRSMSASKSPRNSFTNPAANPRNGRIDRAMAALDTAGSIGRGTSVTRTSQRPADQATQRVKFHSFNSLTGKTGLDAGGL